MAEVVVDASALVDLLLGNELGAAVATRLAGHALHAPAHVDAEILSAVGRLHRAREIDANGVEAMLTRLTAGPIRRHPVTNLLIGAWSKRHQLRLADALYVELAASRALPLITTDGRLHPVPVAEIVVA
jgi:predicted nucleic acid-binding protein